MVDDTLISDDLLRQLVAVGQVDLVVGVVTHDHASTIGELVRAVHKCFATFFPRQRTVLLNSDGGSTDETAAIVRACCVDETDTVTTSHRLRTAHRISARHHPALGRADAIRLVLKSAELLQAKALVLLDPDLIEVAPERVASLAMPVLVDGFDFLAPVYDRPPADGLLVTQLLRPLFGGLYGRTLSEPLAAEGGYSGGFVTTVTEDVAVAVDALALTSTALTGPYSLGQVYLGPRLVSPGRARGSVGDVFREVVGTAFDALEAHASHWLTSTTSEAVPIVSRGVAHASGEWWASSHGARLPETFADDVRNLDEILRRVLAPGTFEAIASNAASPAPPYPDRLWAATVAEFLVAYHTGVMRRDHIIQALMPLYMARAGVFLREHETTAPAGVTTAHDAICAEFVEIKRYVVEHWLTSARGTS